MVKALQTLRSYTYVTSTIQINQKSMKQMSSPFKPNLFLPIKKHLNLPYVQAKSYLKLIGNRDITSPTMKDGSQHYLLDLMKLMHHHVENVKHIKLLRQQFQVIIFWKQVIKIHSSYKIISKIMFYYTLHTNDINLMN